MDWLNFDYSLILRLLAAVLLGGAIGLERGGNNHEAGLRTHIIVCLGSASVMILSQCLIMQYGIPGELMRMGAQVISGIGFLGVGSIIADGNRIRGITTAAGIWTTACVGLIVGSGYYVLATALVILMLFAMLGLRPLASKIQSRARNHSIQIELIARGSLPSVLSALSASGIELIKFRHIEHPDSSTQAIVLDLKLPPQLKLSAVLYSLSEVDGVTGLHVVD